METIFSNYVLLSKRLASEATNEAMSLSSSFRECPQTQGRKYPRPDLAPYPLAFIMAVKVPELKVG